MEDNENSPAVIQYIRRDDEEEEEEEEHLITETKEQILDQLVLSSKRQPVYGE